MSVTTDHPTAFDIDRALLREFARLGNLLCQLRNDVQGGALSGEPQDAVDVLRGIDHRLQSLLALRTE